MNSPTRTLSGDQGVSATFAPKPSDGPAGKPARRPDDESNEAAEVQEGFVKKKTRGKARCAKKKQKKRG